MRNLKQNFMAAAFALAAVLTLGAAGAAQAASSDDLNRDSAQALQHLTETNHTAAEISRHARAVLIFPNIVKAGLVFGGAYGEGTLMKGGHVVDYYNSVTGDLGGSGIANAVLIQNARWETSLPNFGQSPLINFNGLATVRLGASAQ